MSTAIHAQVSDLARGKHPRFIARLGSGWAVLGPWQKLRGYCLLLPDPVVPQLNALRGKARLQFLDDMARLGEAVLNVTKAARINYEMLGNLEPALHAHVFPRFDDEIETLRTKPVWFYDWSVGPAFDATTDRALIDQLARQLG